MNNYLQRLSMDPEKHRSDCVMIKNGISYPLLRSSSEIGVKS